MPGHTSTVSSSESISEDEPSPARKKLRDTTSLVQEPSQDELDYRCEKYPDVSKVKRESVSCTSCGADMKCFVELGQPVFFNPFLQVLMCKKCSSYYSNGDFSLDEDGSDKYCRWCGQGGEMFCCSSCTSAFCKACLKRNLSRTQFREVQDADSWDCFLCNVRPLWDLRAICWAAQTHINSLKQTRRKLTTNELTSMVKRKTTPQKPARLQRRGCDSSSEDDSEKRSVRSSRRNNRSIRRKDSSSSEEENVVRNGSSRRGGKLKYKSRSEAGPSRQKDDLIVLDLTSDDDFVKPKAKKDQDRSRVTSSATKDVEMSKSSNKKKIKDLKKEQTDSSDDEVILKHKNSLSTSKKASDTSNDDDKDPLTSKKPLVNEKLVNNTDKKAVVNKPTPPVSENVTEDINSSSRDSADDDALPEKIDMEAAKSSLNFFDSEFKALKKLIKKSTKIIQHLDSKREKISDEKDPAKLIRLTGKLELFSGNLKKSLEVIETDVSTHTKIWTKKVISKAKAQRKLPKKKKVDSSPLSTSDVEKKTAEWEEEKLEMESRASWSSSDDRRKAGKKARKKQRDDSPCPSTEEKNIEKHEDSSGKEQRNSKDVTHKSMSDQDTSFEEIIVGKKSTSQTSIVGSKSRDSDSESEVLDHSKNSLSVSDVSLLENTTRDVTEPEFGENEVDKSVISETSTRNVSAAELGENEGDKSVISERDKGSGSDSDHDDRTPNENATDGGTTQEYDLLLKPHDKKRDVANPDASNYSSDSSDFPMETQKPSSLLKLQASCSRTTPGSESDDESDGAMQKSRPGPKSKTRSPRKRKKSKSCDEDKENNPSSTRVRTQAVSDDDVQAPKAVDDSDNANKSFDDDFETTKPSEKKLGKDKVRVNSPDPFSVDEPVQNVSDELVLDELETTSKSKTKVRAGPKSRTQRRKSSDELTLNDSESVAPEADASASMCDVSTVNEVNAAERILKTDDTGNDKMKLTEDQRKAKLRCFADLSSEDDDDDCTEKKNETLKMKTSDTEGPTRKRNRESSSDDDVTLTKMKVSKERKGRVDSNIKKDRESKKKDKSKSGVDIDLTTFKDSKLSDGCSVQISVLNEEILKEHKIALQNAAKSRKKRGGKDESDSDASITRLTNLKNLCRGKRRRRNSSDSPSSAGEGTSKAKTPTKAKKKEKSPELRPVDFLNKSSDSDAYDSPPPNDTIDSLPPPEVVFTPPVVGIDGFWKKNLGDTSPDDAHSDEDDDPKKDKKKRSEKKKKKEESDGDEEKEEKKKAESGDDKEEEENKKDSVSDDEKEKKKGKKEKDNSESDSSRTSKKKKGKGWRNNRLLRGRLSLSDSSDEERREKNVKKRMEKAKEEAKAKKNGSGSNSSDEDVTAIQLKKSRKKRNRVASDSDNANPIQVSSSTSDSDDDFVKKKSSSKRKKKSSTSSSDSEAKKKKRRRRIKRPKGSSDSDDDPDGKQDTPGKGRKNIRKVMKEESVGEKTRRAAKEEEERKARITEKQKLYNELYDVVQDSVTVTKELVLDFDAKTKKELVVVAPSIVKKLKPHQVKGVKFMWDACFESLERMKKSEGTGCILAHCMGLGKTFQVVTLVHTLLSNAATKIKTVLVVCPLSTVLNWVSEFKMWLKDMPDDEEFEVFEMSKTMSATQRKYILEQWNHEGGVMVMGYDGYRNLSNAKVGQGKGAQRITKKILEAFETTLVNPGPDVVVCDEGHLLKNEDTATSKAFSKIRTRRRILLTGTPLQNNLKEYHCMVNFVKPNLLGTAKEFQNRFLNPICNGQFENSTEYDVKIMKRRAHVLHKMLEHSIQRFDYTVLTPFLPPKYEYVISIRLSEVQTKIYQHYLDNISMMSLLKSGGRSNRLFADWQYFQRICTHPKVLLWHTEENIEKQLDKEEEDSEGSLRDFIDDDDDDTSSEDESGSEKEKEKPAPRRATTRRLRGQPEQPPTPEPEVPDAPAATSNHQLEWWKTYCTDDDLQNMASSGKLQVFFALLAMAEKIGDKVLVFSQSLGVLSLIEDFLGRIDDDTQRRIGKDEEKGDPLLCGHTGSWAKGLDYFRLDGSVSVDNRSRDVKLFNNSNNLRARLFLISTKAGGLGINLFAANRVIIFDASWNPSHDVQSLFRVYRFGQKKPCYIYRLVAYGTMEEKVYERQVTKLSLACRVVDEQQIERHYSNSDMLTLYQFEPNPREDRPTPILPKDRLLADLMNDHREWFETYHEHDSLLENVAEEELNEDERKAAWEDYETEKKGRVLQQNPLATQNQYYINNPGMVREALRQQNPLATDDQIDNFLINMLANAYQSLHEGYMSNTAPPVIGQINPYRGLAENRVKQLKQQRLEQARVQFYRMQQQNQMPGSANLLANLMQGAGVGNPYAAYNAPYKSSVPNPFAMMQAHANSTGEPPAAHSLLKPSTAIPMPAPGAAGVEQPRIKVRSFANIAPKVRLDTVATQQKVDKNDMAKLVANPLFAGNKPAIKPTPKPTEFIDLD